MKRIIAIVASILTVASLCLATGDATSDTQSDEKKDATTFQRDGTNILRCVQYKSEDPNRRILRQQVLMGETKVAEIVDFQGKQAFNVQPNLPVTVGFVHSPTGGLESVVLMDDAHGIVEAYEVTGGRLAPIAGWQLEQARELTQGFSDFVDAAVKKEESPTQLKARVWWMVLKAKWNELMHKEPEATR